MSFVVPAVLPTSKQDLEEKLTLLTALPTVTRIQIDVVDGRFASPASWPYSAKATNGTPYLDSTGSPQAAPNEIDDMVARSEMLPALDRVEYEIDLMCLDTERAVGAWLALGASRLTFHAESAVDLPRLLASVRRRYGSDLVTLGLALNVASDLSLIEPFLPHVAYVQFMGIANIGRQGQLFDQSVIERVRVFHVRHPEIPLQVDGGVSLAVAKKLLVQGASSLVVGSAILRANEPGVALAEFESLQTSYGV
ncbi:MAG: hypothetical protein WAW90_01160 [Minisyncoccia bacterium]